tara:strand:+ start:950 stop:1813 length:864 start_codon:yes stop_codon:yes gene_type:complete
MTKAVNDKYFTKPSVAKACVDMLNLEDYDLIFEPSAGCGSFLVHLPEDKAKAADLAPDIPEVVQMDFYNIQKVIDLLDLRTNPDKKYLSIGNPPFGTMADMAIDFFNGCAEFSDTVAFILPRTFRKPSVTNRLNMSFHLREETLLGENSFLILNPKSSNLIQEYDVPCTFQIWDKRDVQREKIQTKSTSPHLNFVSKIDKATYAFRRVGGNAGLLYDTSNQKTESNPSGISMKPPSHFYINCKPEVAKAIRGMEWDYFSSKYDTAGNPSISKHELITKLEKILDKED